MKLMYNSSMILYELWRIGVIKPIFLVMNEKGEIIKRYPGKMVKNKSVVWVAPTQPIKFTGKEEKAIRFGAAIEGPNQEEWLMKVSDRYFEVGPNKAVHVDDDGIITQVEFKKGEVYDEI